MRVQKLRLQHGWSQQQLAELSGLNVRTIQRIEKGQEASVESLKSLAAVFNVDFSTLKEQDMGQSMDNTIDATRNAQEQLAFNQVRKLKAFYVHLARYVLVSVILTAVNVFASPHRWWVQWVILGWGLGVLMHGLRVSDRFNGLGAEWEKKQVEKRLGRKL
jgi:transcriptional regulator with XRE-family HTH domain